MPAWIDALLSAQTVAAMGAIIFLGWGAVKLWKPLRALVRFLDRLIGSPDNPGLLDRMAELEQKVARIHAEVTPNHGGSIKDSLRRVEEKVDQIESTQQRDQQRLEQVAETVEEIREDSDDA